MIGKVDPSWVKLLVRRAEGETASDMRRHSRPNQKVSALNYSKVEHLANLLIFRTLWRT